MQLKSIEHIVEKITSENYHAKGSGSFQGGLSLCRFIRALRLLVLLFLLIAKPAISVENPLSVAVLADPKQFDAFNKWFNQFQTIHPRISLNVDFYSDENYKRKLDHWLEEGTYDVLYWQGGKRLERLVNRGVITPISSLLSSEEIKSSLPQSIINSVSYNNSVQALPFAQYAWGFYYNKDVFARLGLTPPKTWKAFKKLCNTLASNGISPLIQANRETWPPLAWLDYLTLLNGGLKTRNSLINGEALTAEQYNQVLNDLRWLVESDLFFAQNHAWQWQQTIPIIVRKKAAMTLMGQFAESAVNRAMEEVIGFFPFPEVHASGFEVTPMELFVVSSASNNKTIAKVFLKYMLDSQVQMGLSSDLGWLPVRFDILPSEAITERQGIALEAIANSHTLLPYFDRDATQVLSNHYGDSLVAAISQGNVEPFIQALHGSPENQPPKVTLKPSKNHKSLASLQGHKGTFLASKIVRLAYNTLGFDISVTRFPSIEAGLKSQQFGMDGELARIADFAKLSDQLIQVPEPIFELKLYLVYRQKNCSPTNLPDYNPDTVAASSDALLFRQWTEKQGVKLEQFGDEFQMWQAFKDKNIDALISLEAGLVEQIREVKDACYTPVAETPIYHYVNKRNEHLVLPLSHALSKLKTDEKYRRTIAEFGIGTLD